MSKIIWTETDEAPALASYSLLPIIQAFAKNAGVHIETRDISLAGRILALFSGNLPNEQKVANNLSELGELAKKPEANIIKLPNISASTPQLKEAIEELQNKGYKIPNYSDNPQTDADKQTAKMYKTVTGSAVNPVLREGNSDRRIPESVKSYARKFPHAMGKWEKTSKTHVATMQSGDFKHNEKSTTIAEATIAKIVLISKDGKEIILAESIPLEKGEIVDATFMSKKALTKFLEEQIQDAKEKGILFSIHMKATMMKVSDPVIFGHTVKVFFKDLITKHADTIKNLGVNFNSGLGDLYEKMEKLPIDKKIEIEADIQAAYKNRPMIAMVDSIKGITNLHVPSDVIVDASMPAAIKAGGKMWDKNNQERDVKLTIPDSTYAALYDETIKNCIENGALDPTKIGTIPNIGLMAQAAEEYGSHNTAYEITHDGILKVIDANGNTIHEHEIESGDIWRLVRVKDAPVRDWVKLGVERARATKWKTIFWLDEDRAHTVELRKKVDQYLKEYDLQGLDIEIMSQKNAAKISIERMRKGENTNSVTGNILRDYVTDLYPIMEVGTSAKMLSIVPLMGGGGLYETGAGGSAPKHVEQLIKENYLRWDSLGEFLALVPSLEKIAETDNNAKAKILAKKLDQATGKLLENNKSPQRKLGTIDNRGSHFYLAMYWAEALSKQTEDKELAEKFATIYDNLAKNANTIINEFISVQGHSADIGGYYKPNFEKVSAVMRPSITLNKIINEM